MPLNLPRSNTKSLPASKLRPPISCLVYTSPALADAMVSAVNPRVNQTWLEPSCGGGAFLMALSRAGVPKSNITGIDLDGNVVEPDRLAVVSRSTEFLEWAQGCRRKFDCVIGNPPFVRASELPVEVRDRITLSTLPNGEKLSRAANLWAAFLAHAIRLVKSGGNLAFVLPAAWEYADYASGLRVQISNCFREIDVHRCAVPLFDSVHDGSVVLIAKNRCEGTGRSRRFYHPTLVHLIESLRHDRTTKAVRVDSEPRETCAESHVTLDEVLEIDIGAVTGDAEFFLLTETQRKDRGLPKAACYPVISRTRDLKDAVITSDIWKSLLQLDSRVWLFRPSESLCDQAPIKKYLELNESEGGCRRNAYKIQDRQPWYKVRLPKRAEVFLSGQSSVGPWFSINQCPRLTASNTLYVARFREKQTIPQMAAWGLALMSSGVFEQWSKLARKYPDGLLKLEPSDLKQLVLPRPLKTQGARREYQAAIQLLHGGKPAEARSRADAWLAEFV